MLESRKKKMQDNNLHLRFKDLLEWMEDYFSLLLDSWSYVQQKLNKQGIYIAFALIFDKAI